jgi:hypothetical protein
LDGIRDRWINPQKKCFALGHVIPLIRQCYTETQRHRDTEKYAESFLRRSARKPSPRRSVRRAEVGI